MKFQVLVGDGTLKKSVNIPFLPAFVFPEFSKQTMAASHASKVEPPDFRIEVAVTQASLQTLLYCASSKQFPAPEIHKTFSFEQFFICVFFRKLSSTSVHCYKTCHCVK